MMCNLFEFPTPSILLHVDAAILLSEQLLQSFDAALTISETSEDLLELGLSLTELLANLKEKHSNLSVAEYYTTYSM
jgi:hypothetical protein